MKKVASLLGSRELEAVVEEFKEIESRKSKRLQLQGKRSLSPIKFSCLRIFTHSSFIVLGPRTIPYSFDTYGHDEKTAF